MRQAQQTVLARYRRDNPGIQYRLLGSRLQYRNASGTWDNVNPSFQDNFDYDVQQESERAENRQIRQQRAASVGNVFSSIGQRFFGGAGAVGNFALGGAGNLLSGLLSLLTRGLTMLFATLAGVLLAGAGGVVLAFKRASDAALEFGKAALSIRAQTGLSYGASGSLLSRGLAFGFSASDTASQLGNQNPLIASLRGNNYQSSTYYSDLSREFNGYLSGGSMSTMIGRAMMKARGVTDEQLNIAAMNPTKVAAQEKWSNGITGRLGLSGNQIATLAEDLQLAGNKVSTIFQLLKIRLGAIIAPQLVAGLEKVADFFGRNSGRITAVLERVGTALSGVFLRGLETALNFLDSNKDSIGEWFNKAFDFILYEAPPLFLRAAAGIMRALAFVLDAFSSGIDWLVKHAPEISDFFNNITKGFIENIPSITQVLGDLWTTVEKVVGGIRDVVKGLAPGENQSTAGRMAGGLGGWIRKGFNAIGLKNGNPDSGSGFDNGLNTVVGGLAAYLGARPLLGLAGRGLGALIGGGLPSLGGLSLPSLGGLGSGLMTGLGALSSPFVTIPALGTAIGAYTYNGLQKVTGENGPSAGQIASYYWNRARGYSGLESAAIAQGLDPTKLNGGVNSKEAIAKREAASKAASKAATQQDIQKSLDALTGKYGANSTNGMLARGAAGLNNLAQSGLRDLQQHGPGWARSAAEGASFLNGKAGDAEGLANNWGETLKRIEANTNNTAKNTKEAIEVQKKSILQTGMMVDILGRSLAYNAQDEALAIARGA